MRLDIVKRFEFAAAHKYWDSALTEAENFQKYGKDSLGKFGHGHNFIVFFYLTGEIDSKTGMILELSKVKAIIKEKVLSKYDHRYLNELDVFKSELPTPTVIANVLFRDACDVFKDTGLVVTECLVIETATSQASVTLEGLFSILGSKEETVVYDQNGEKKESRVRGKIGDWIVKPDAIDLRLFFVIHATHCLTNSSMSALEHDSLFGKCQFVHGHEFEIELRVSVQEQSEEFASHLYDLIATQLEDWQYKSLNDEVPELQHKLCTCETIINVLHTKLASAIPVPIREIVLKETPNNAFRLTL